jgi:hypothetical protein
VSAVAIAALSWVTLASTAAASGPAKAAIIREPSSPVGDAVIDALLAGPDETVRFEVRQRPVEGSRVELARKLCAEATWRGVYWFDTTREREFWVVLFECGSGRVRVREVPADPAAEQAAIEEMWLIARASATALVTGGSIAMDERDPTTVDVPTAPKEPAEPARSPVVRATKPSATRANGRKRPALRASLAYAGDAFARARPWQHAIAIGFAVEPTKLLRVGIGYAFFVPASLRGSDVRLLRHLVALHVGVFGGGDRVTAEGRAGIEVELQRWRSDEDREGGLRPVPLAALDVLLAIRLWRGLFLELGPGVGVPLARVDYVRCRTGGADCTGSDRRVVADAWPARPRARIGFAVRF